MRSGRGARRWTWWPPWPSWEPMPAYRGWPGGRGGGPGGGRGPLGGPGGGWGGGGAGTTRRLGWEFEKYLDGIVEDVWWHRGRCLSYGDGVAFWALAEIVRQRLGIAEEDPAEAAAVKLAKGLDRFVPDSGERAYVGVRLGRL